MDTNSGVQYTDLDDWCYKVLNIDNIKNFANPDNYYHFVYRVKCDIWLMVALAALCCIFTFIEFVYNSPLFKTDTLLVIGLFFSAIFLFLIATSNVVTFIENRF